MALNRAKVTDVSPVYADGKVNVTVQFYDSTAPTTILRTEVIPFEAYKSIDELSARVKAIGADEKKRRQTVDSALAAIPVGAEVVI